MLLKTVLEFTDHEKTHKGLIELSDYDLKLFKDTQGQEMKYQINLEKNFRVTVNPNETLKVSFDDPERFVTLSNFG